MHNEEFRAFVIDALQNSHLEFIDPGALCQDIWAGRECDFYSYIEELKNVVANGLDSSGQDFISFFPSRDWLISDATQHVQFQTAFAEHIKKKRWDLIICGAMETEFGLLLYDMPDTLRPQIAGFYHGLLSGDPWINLFLRADKIFSRSKTESGYYADLGVPKDTLCQLGSVSINAFPEPNEITRMRAEAREKLDLQSDTHVISYALAYDTGIYPSICSPEHIHRLIVDAMKLLGKGAVLNNPTLLLKYHPAPVDDPHFSYSRHQFPLSKFAELESVGIRVMLIKDLKLAAAADCFIAHESSAIFYALEAAVPTLSIRLLKDNSRSLISESSYQKSNAHFKLTALDPPDLLSSVIERMVVMDRNIVYEDSKQLWSHEFECGRAESLKRFAEKVTEVLGSKRARISRS